MQSIIIGFGEDKVDIITNAASIRMSYILANQLRLAGNHHTLFRIREDMKRSKLQDKIAFIKSHDITLTQDVDDTLSKFLKDIPGQKQLRNMPRNSYVAFKKIEGAVNMHFDSLVERLFIPYIEGGMVNLQPLENMECFEVYPVLYTDTEKSNEYYYPLSEILQFQLEEEDMEFPSVLFLHHHFFDNDFRVNRDSSIPEPGTFTGSGFMVQLVSFYEIVAFSLEELDTIKAAAKDALKKLHNALDHFISLKSNPAHAFDYSQQNLKPVAHDFMNQLEATDTHAHYKKNTFMDFKPYELYAGMLPWKTIYSYYKHINVLKDKTLDIIDSITPPAEWMPVLILKHLHADNNNVGTPLLQNETSLKKSLEL